jgi:lipopolysaccharide/colanic/teichoic acid biosynthesis glycosyltransferase
LINFWRIPVVARLIYRVARLSRGTKLARFYASCRPTQDDLVLDVGVTSAAWSTTQGCPRVENFLEGSYPWPERIVGLSIDALQGFQALYPQVAAVRGDGCRLPFRDGAFDIVFSNAVIEHVGDRRQQARFVEECVRVARRAVFVAAPNRWFPYDTHVAFPLIHWLPRFVWRRLLTEPALHLISPPALLRLFPRSSRPRRLSPAWTPSTTVFAAPALGRCPNTSRAGQNEVVRRTMDVTGASIGLLLVGPLIAISAALVWLEDRGPVLHRRRVLGRGGREFDAFKLRTMRVDADDWLARQPELLAQYQENVKLQGDPRVTLVGRILRKLSIDELPQLVNVLKGDMSLVGPRMIHPSELKRYGSFGLDRLAVKPGITGLWQVSGRQELDYGERIQLDRRYLSERSLRLDIEILFRTLPAVLRGRGAH